MATVESLPAAEWLATLRDGDEAAADDVADGRQGPLADVVRLLGFPVALGEAQSERSQELMRELRLLLIGRDRGDEKFATPQRLVDLTAEFVAAYGGSLAGATAERQEALGRGDETIDLEYALTGGSRTIILRYAEAMEEMDDYCRSGAVITLPSPRSMVALRRWIVAEFVRQYDGLAPTAWTGPLA